MVNRKKYLPKFGNLGDHNSVTKPYAFLHKNTNLESSTRFFLPDADRVGGCVIRLANFCKTKQEKNNHPKHSQTNKNTQTASETIQERM